MIRDATPADFQAALPVGLQAHRQSPLGFIEPDLLQMERTWISFTVQDGYFSRVVEHDGEIVGVMLGGIFPGTSGGRMAHDVLCYARRDSDKLIREFYEWAIARGADVVLITDMSGSPRYRKLIERMGFDSIGTHYMRKP